MSYRIDYLEEVFFQLARVPKNIRNIILKAIENRLSVDPCRFKPLTANWQGCFRMRIGDYRIIYRVDKEAVTVLIIKTDVRGRIYE